MSSDSATYRTPLRRAIPVRPLRLAALGRLRTMPELIALMGLAGALNLWGLSINGWANTYYSAAVRSMSTSWHNFLFASMDPSGLMTVDKPPLSLWIQALSARVFGFHPLSVLVPQALMGVAATALVYDLTRRRFGRAAAFAAGLALATTPIVVAVSRHNNPDELLVLCCVAALWLGLRAVETGRTKWLVLCGVCVGLGFETKMGVALMVVPGLAAGYLYVAPRGRLAAVRQLLAGGVALALVGLAWPVLVTLTPAADRPWISGTADNSIWSLIFSYNGVGRITGQSGGPGALGAPGGGGGGALFGGSTGFFRLLQSGLGDQAGWLLGFAVVAGLGVLVSTRLRRRDPRSGWLIVVGGAFLTSAIAFSFAQGIFHPYYVSFVAPFTAALVGAGVGLGLAPDRTGRVFAALAIVAGTVTELIVLGHLGGQLSWAKPLIIAAAAVGVLTLVLRLSNRVRGVLIGVALAMLLAAPAAWAEETIGHATNGTFPAGGPAGSLGGIGGPGGGGRLGRHGGLRFRGAFGSARGFFPGAAGAGLPGPPGAGPGFGRPGAGNFAGPGGPGFPGRRGSPAPGGFGSGGIFGADSASLNAAIRYARAHGGGTIGVSSQSSAAAAILAVKGDVAGLGGFSGRESSVSAAWIAMELRDGHLRWVIADGAQDFRARGDTRAGSQAALSVVSKVCRAVTVSSSVSNNLTMYDCQGRAPAIVAAAGRL